MLLKANSYRLKVKNGFEVQKYALAYTPEIPDNSKVSFKIMKSCREKLKEKFVSYMPHGNFLFSTSMYPDVLEFDAEHDGQDYKVEVKWTKNVTKDPLESGAFQSIVFKSILGRMSFERDGRNMFNPAKAVNI